MFCFGVHFSLASITLSKFLETKQPEISFLELSAVRDGKNFQKSILEHSEMSMLFSILESKGI